MDSEKEACRSSILKPQRPKSPPAIVESTVTQYKEKRRVSFASSNFVKPFAADPEKNTIWDNTYEEEVSHTDSVRSSGSHADEHVSSLNVSMLDKSSLHIPELDQENILHERFEQGSNSDIKIYNDFENVPSMVECIKKNKTVIFDDNVMELTSLVNDNKEIEQTEFTAESIFSNQCYGSKMEFTAPVGCMFEEQSNLLKKEESVSTDHHIQSKENNQKNEDKDILSTNVQDICQVQSKADNQGNYSKINKTEDMDFTDVLPNFHKILQLESSIKETNQMKRVENDYTLLNKSATMEFTMLPGIQDILKTDPAERKGGGSSDISNVSEYVDMELTNVLPSLQKNSGLLERPVDTFCNDYFPSDLKTAIQSKVKNNQTMDESLTMEFTNMLPDIQAITKTTDHTILNKSITMELTNVLPDKQDKTVELNKDLENICSLERQISLIEQLDRSTKNNVLYSEPGYLNAQDMTAPSTSFGINLSPCVSQQRVLATVQPSDSLQGMFRDKSFGSVSFSVLDAQVPDCNELDILTNHPDVIDMTLKDRPDQSNVYALDNTSDVLINDSDNTLDSYCDYTQHCRAILSNLEKYLVPGDTLMLTNRGKEREKRFQKVCKELEEAKSKVDEFEKNFTLPALDWMNFEEIFKQHKADSSKDNVTDESILLETKVPKMKDTKSLLERVQEAAERNNSYWQFIKCEKDHYYFTTLFETLPFIVHLHPELGIVYRVETFKNIKDNLEPVFYYNHDYVQFKLKQDNLLSVLGSKYDILTLLDYICMTITAVVEFHHNLKQLGDKYVSSHKLRMTSDFRIILEILNEELIIWWIISIKLSKTTIGLVEDIAATSELGEKVNRDHIKQIGEKIASGCIKSYIESLVQKIDEYVQRVGRGIRYRRENEHVE